MSEKKSEQDLVQQAAAGILHALSKRDGAALEIKYERSVSVERQSLADFGMTWKVDPRPQQEQQQRDMHERCAETILATARQKNVTGATWLWSVGKCEVGGMTTDQDLYLHLHLRPVLSSSPNKSLPIVAISKL